MAPKIKTNEEDILTAAVQITRESGIDAVNARGLAEKLGCSVQPIFRAFSSMDTLKAAVYKRAADIYNGQMMEAVENGGFQRMGRAYIHFAKTEQNLFKLLFMTDTFHDQDILNIAGSTQGDGEVIGLLSGMTGLDKAKAQRLYTGAWFASHGIASLLATNNCAMDEEETGYILSKIFEGLVKVL